MKKQVVLKVYGKVQGVFFRDSARSKAGELNLFGWVRNESEGTVGIVAEGEEENLKKLIEWCHGGGGKYSEVKKVDVAWREPTGQFNNFLVK